MSVRPSMGYTPPRRVPARPPETLDECRVCDGAHDPELHAAVLHLRAVLRRSLALALAPVAKPKRGPSPKSIGRVDLRLVTAEERRAASRKGGIGNRRQQC